MGLLDIFKRKDKSETEAENQAIKTDFKTQLDTVEKAVYEKLKPLGFKKSGRTLTDGLTME